MDGWTAAHLLAGATFAFICPFVQLMVLTVMWKLIEWRITRFGEPQNSWNRVLDIGASAVGWCVISAAFQHSPENWCWYHNGVSFTEWW